MQKVAIFLASILGTTIVAFAGCSGNGGGSGASTTTTHASVGPTGSGGHTSSSTTSASTGGATSSSSGTVMNPAICNPPTPPPSMGSCVTFATQDGGEADAGLDDAGKASQSICNPVTNAGCVGTDICDTDNSGKHWICYQGGTPAVGPCGDCSNNPGLCKGGNACINFTNADGGVLLTECVKYCCTDADCGGMTGTCNHGVNPPPPDNVGICTQ